jgi:glyceraldehyde 3-phosphate dehydrogenase/glyceraldehyde-3-phosphate dehydrogenase (NAD(P))
MKRIGINGLGRIGRLVLRYYMLNPSDAVDIVVANDLTSIDDLAYLIRFDSVHGKAPYKVLYDSSYIQLGSKRIKVLNEKDPAKLPWKKLGVDIVLECTGLFRKREDAAKHIIAGASKVIISAPSDSADLTIVQGVNEDLYNPKIHHVVSNASCTTNSLAPAVKVLHDTFGIGHLLITTVHAYTSSQALIDRSARKLRRGRAAAVSLIPTSTGAAKATALVLPELKDKMDAMAIRAPVPDGAITDIVAELQSDVTVDIVNKTFEQAAKNELKGILGYSEDELVSADILGDTHSGIIDATSTKVVDKRMVKVLVWYDNEAGYAKRLLELAEFISKLE